MYNCITDEKFILLRKREKIKGSEKREMAVRRKKNIFVQCDESLITRSTFVLLSFVFRFLERL